MILGWMPVIFFQFDQHSGETIRTQNYLSAQFPWVKIMYKYIKSNKKTHDDNTMDHDHLSRRISKARKEA